MPEPKKDPKASNPNKPGAKPTQPQHKPEPKKSGATPPTQQPKR